MLMFTEDWNCMDCGIPINSFEGDLCFRCKEREEEEQKKKSSFTVTPTETTGCLVGVFMILKDFLK